MPAASWGKYALLAYLSRPSWERSIYRLLAKTPVSSIVELGLGAGLRAERMISVILRNTPADSIRYTGIDLFEARPSESPGMTFKEAFRWSKKLGVKAELIPGDPLSALARAANRLTKTDLVVIAADQDPEALTRAWFYVPRMLTDSSIVLLQAPDVQGAFRIVERREVDMLAAASQAARKVA